MLISVHRGKNSGTINLSESVLPMAKSQSEVTQTAVILQHYKKNKKELLAEEELLKYQRV